MTKKILITIIFATFLFINTSSVFAGNVEDLIGKITAPSPIAGFLEKNPTGSGAISQFLSNLVTLIYGVAGTVLIFMFVWGAFEWLISAGDKEKIATAQKTIINAVIGILLFAIAFAVIRIIGTFTGFTFFKDSNKKVGTANDAACKNYCQGIPGNSFPVMLYVTYPGTPVTYHCNVDACPYS